MARFEGNASIRRAFMRTDGSVTLDIKPDGFDWQWAEVEAERGRAALASSIAGISGGFKLYVSLPDDATSVRLEFIGITNTREE